MGRPEDRDQAEAGLGDHRDHRRHPQQHGRHPGPHAHLLADPAKGRGAPGQHQHRLHQQVVDHEEGQGGGREGGQRHPGMVGVAAGQRVGHAGGPEGDGQLGRVEQHLAGRLAAQQVGQGRAGPQGDHPGRGAPAEHQGEGERLRHGGRVAGPGPAQLQRHQLGGQDEGGQQEHRLRVAAGHPGGGGRGQHQQGEPGHGDGGGVGADAPPGGRPCRPQLHLRGAPSAAAGPASARSSSPSRARRCTSFTNDPPPSAVSIPKPYEPSIPNEQPMSIDGNPARFATLLGVHRRPRSSQAVPRTLLAVHAHPDDESSKGAATMARYADEGVRVVVVTCTGGEAGEILNPAMDQPGVLEQMPELRRQELAKALEIIDVTAHHWLGYRDSGMAEYRDQRPPRRLRQRRPGRGHRPAGRPHPGRAAPGGADLRRARRLPPPRPHPHPRGLGGRLRGRRRPRPLPRGRAALPAAQALLPRHLQPGADGADPRRGGRPRDREPVRRVAGALGRGGRRHPRAGRHRTGRRGRLAGPAARRPDRPRHPDRPQQLLVRHPRRGRGRGVPLGGLHPGPVAGDRSPSARPTCSRGSTRTATRSARAAHGLCFPAWRSTTRSSRWSAALRWSGCRGSAGAWPRPCWPRSST